MSSEAPFEILIRGDSDLWRSRDGFLDVWVRLVHGIVGTGMLGILRIRLEDYFELE